MLSRSKALLWGLVIATSPAVLSAQTTTRVSVSTSGVEANQNCVGTAISADGRYVVFQSTATNLVAGDSNAVEDVFLHDRETGITTRESVTSSELQANDHSGGATISADGRYIAFSSLAINLTFPNFPAALSDVFLRDRQAGTTICMSSSSANGTGNDASFSPVVSADGRFVAFTSIASDLVSGDLNTFSDIFVFDVQTSARTIVSRSSSGVRGNTASSGIAISGDGRFVAFGSHATNLVLSDTNGAYDVFVHDRQTGETTRVSVASDGSEVSEWCTSPSISADGRFVAFDSVASDLVAGDTNGATDVFVHDRMTGSTVRVSVNSLGVQANDWTANSKLSADGRYVSFWSRATNLVPDDTNGVADFFRHDRQTGATVRVSLSASGAQGNAASSAISVGSAISSDGRFVAFPSEATNLVPSDGNGRTDIFVRDMIVLTTCAAGTVDLGNGPAADVLLVDGSAGDADQIVHVSLGAPFDIALNAAPAGPGGPGDPRGRYVLWVWPSLPTNPVDFTAGSDVLGCTVNPTPLRPLLTPQPVRCLRGTGLPPNVNLCGAAHSVRAPARAPWLVTRNRGFASPVSFTLQALLEDAGAANTWGFSVTNAVLLRIE